MVNPDTIKDIYIKETIDSEGRVIELKFMNGNQIVEFTCFEPSIIKYEYEQNKIIEYQYYADFSKINGVKCGVPYKTIYNIQNDKITSCLQFYDYEPYLTTYAKDMSKEELEKIKQEYQKNKNGVVGNCDIIPGYVYSSARYKGMNIVSENYNSDNYHFPYFEDASKSRFSFNNSIK
ncbi:hypothetical protein GWO43_25095 [candidate division KSB1 bacterium]|nr:hypothetical protein [candidate division KSB1 bacterium]NIR68840.1 hypothetical protein [candidate division KSB1 bacterium]NIS27204.1 hypothetical protein [candidate division KSB1 bacterium]NIT74089.1 hypothetical protein [candidate division KSB1 bacterium]NIU27938.1 hypothetical protein [candidate division KSB1 bacterium]